MDSFHVPDWLIHSHSVWRTFNYNLLTFCRLLLSNKVFCFEYTLRKDFWQKLTHYLWSRIITYYTLRNYTFLARVLQALSDPLLSVECLSYLSASLILNISETMRGVHVQWGANRKVPMMRPLVTSSMTSRDWLHSHVTSHNLQNHCFRKLGPGSTIHVDL